VTPDSSGSLVYAWEDTEQDIIEAVCLDMFVTVLKVAPDAVAIVVNGERLGLGMFQLPSASGRVMYQHSVISSLLVGRRGRTASRLSCEPQGNARPLGLNDFSGD
jgi:hypothetical protein